MTCMAWRFVEKNMVPRHYQEWESPPREGARWRCQEIVRDDSAKGRDRLTVRADSAKKVFHEMTARIPLSPVKAVEITPETFATT